MNDGSDLSEGRGTRLLRLRKLAGLSRSAIERKYGLSAATLRSWEDAIGSGLSEKGARRVIYIYRKEKVDCNITWLFYGEGKKPTLNKNKKPQSGPQELAFSENSIKKEIDFFKSLYIDVAIYKVPNNVMLPYYKTGDIVAGLRYYDENISKAIGKDCIVETKDERTMFRRLQTSTIQECYNLVCTNIETTLERPIMYDVEIVAVSPVVWIRKCKL